MKKSVFTLLTLLLCSLNHSRAAYITVDRDVVPGLQQRGLIAQQLHRSSDSAASVQILEVNDRELLAVGHYIHHQFNRCGGHILHDSYEEAVQFLRSSQRTTTPALVDYTVDQHHLVHTMIDQVDEFQIRQVITQLSSFQNRTYDTPEGVAAAHWLADHWRELSQHRSDITVELYNHQSWAQPSVIATIPGLSDETVIVGGHLDSITWLWGGFAKGDHSPGADDNASGIATLTEALRILSQSDYVPQKNLIFMGYAAEEVGLRGSKQIAKDYRAREVNVIGSMQLDMTNFNGSETIINLVDDYTSSEQNAFLGELTETYLKVPWGYTRCGYACSDHVSWHAQNYAVSAPFESRVPDMNGKIHTQQDTLHLSGGHAEHATHFAKLTLAYLIELDQ